MAKSIIRSRPSTRYLSSGLSVTELLLALAIGVGVVAGALAITVSSRNLMQADQTQTDANQNLRSALDIIGNDIRIAGERLSGQGANTIPAIILTGGNDLVLRRNALESVLPVCNAPNNQPLAAGRILISRIGSFRDAVYAQCNNDGPRDKNTNGVPDDLEAWRAYRAENSPTPVKAYAFNNITDLGEFFTYAGDTSSSVGFSVTNSSGGWQQSYSMSEQSVVYLLDERRYRLDGETLELILNGDTANALSVVNGVSNFQVRAVMQDGTVKTSLTPTDDWKKLSSIRVSLTVSDRVLTSEYFPRNILSK